MTISYENDVILLDELVNGIHTASSNTNLSLDRLALFSCNKHIAVCCTDDVTIAHAHIREICHAELLKIAFCQITDRNDTNKDSRAVGNGNRTHIIFAQDFAQSAQGIVLTDNNLAVHRNVLDTRIEIWNEKRLFHMEILQCEFCLLIHLSSTCRNGIDTHRLFQMCVSDRRANGICIRIAVPNDINRLCNVQNDTSLSQPRVAAYFDYHYNILTDMIQFLQK